MEYPEEVIATTKKGKKEVRSLIERGEYLLYEYLDPQTGKPTSNKKKLVLKVGQERREYFMVPAGQRFLLIPLKSKGTTKVWANGEVVEF